MSEDEKVETEKTFSAEETAAYIKQLREENKANRLKAKEAEEKIKAIEDAETAKRGEFQTLAEKYKAESESLKKQLEEVNPYKERFEAFEQQTRTELLTTIPEGKRELVKDLPLEKLREFAKLEASEPASVERGKTTNKTSPKEPQTLTEWRKSAQPK